jgi:hypothetical protein
MRVRRTPNNEKPEAKHIRKLLRQDSSSVFLLFASSANLFSTLQRQKRSKIRKQ